LVHCRSDHPEIDTPSAGTIAALIRRKKGGKMAHFSASLEPGLEGIEQKPVLGPEHERLNVFVGRWRSEGRTEAAPPAASEIMTHQHTYEWLPGGFHVFHRWEGHIGDQESKGIEVIGYDPSSETYEVHFFDGDGWARIYRARVHERAWTFSGTRERCSIMFAEDGHTMRIHWDRSPDGGTWRPLCDIKAIRA
jgi:hypothetical protein